MHLSPEATYCFIKKGALIFSFWGGGFPVFFYLKKGISCIPDIKNHCIPKVGLELLTLLPLLLEFWDYKHVHYLWFMPCWVLNPELPACLISIYQTSYIIRCKEGYIFHLVVFVF